MKELSVQEALRKAEAYCSVAERCQSEVLSKLQSWNISPDQAEMIMHRLLEERFIDEERFCRSFIHDKIRFAKWGKQKILFALRQKGISSEIYIKYIKETDKEVCAEVLKKLIEDKRKLVKAKSEYELNVKLIRFALSRGYEMGEIQRCLKKNDDEEMV